MADDDEPEPLPDITDLLSKKVIGNVFEFLQELKGITSPWPTSRVWLRGVPRLSFSLEPSLFRYRRKGVKMRVAEENLSGDFRRQGAPWLPDACAADPLQLLTVMQHHGVPTRLLDWTENAFAALYFAVRPFEHLNATEEAVVWLLDPVRLGRMRGTEGIPYSDPKLTSLPGGPFPFYPVHRSPRMASQRGSFTIHPFDPQHALMKIALAEVKASRLSPLMGIPILGARRESIRKGLPQAFGQGEFTFFPDLDGLARELRIREGLEGKG